MVFSEEVGCVFVGFVGGGVVGDEDFVRFDAEGC